MNIKLKRRNDLFFSLWYIYYTLKGLDTLYCPVTIYINYNILLINFAFTYCCSFTDVNELNYI